MSKLLEGGDASVLITGPAACGKSTLTKQYAHRLVTDFLEGRGEFVPLLVTVIELAATIGESEPKLGAADDLLGAHIRRTEADNTALADFLIARRTQRKLVVVLDGVDEAGEVRAVLEPYVANRLAGEVMLCVTGRENGIEDVESFADFAHFHIQALNPEQQRYIVKSRMEAAASVRKGEVTTDERVRARCALAVGFQMTLSGFAHAGLVRAPQVEAFMVELDRCDPHGTLCTTPLLLNLMLSEYLRHEAKDSAIQFDGVVAEGTLATPWC